MRKTVHWDISFIFSLTVCVSCHHWSKDVVDREAYSCPLQEISFPRLIVVPLSMSEPDGARNQEQIAASHEIDGVRKEKERLTAASLNKLPLDFSYLSLFYNFILFQTLIRR